MSTDGYRHQRHANAALACSLMAVLVLGTACENDDATSADVAAGGVQFSGTGILRVPGTVGVASPGGDNGNANDPTPAAAFVGTWTLYRGSVLLGPPAWYVHFEPGGSFFISNELDGERVRVRGTYRVSEGVLIGPFTNPGVGDGRVEAVIMGEVLHLVFIEYWHTPHKVVNYAGRKS